jgi:hypothetical protein
MNLCRAPSLTGKGKLDEIPNSKTQIPKKSQAPKSNAGRRLGALQLGI